MTDSSSTNSINQSNADGAYDRVLPEAMALHQDSLITINVDVPACIITGMGLVEKLPAYQEGIQKLPGLPVEQFAKFTDYVLALFTAQSRYTFATTPPEPLPELLEEATNKRDVLIADAKALVTRGLLNGDLLKELTGSHGYKNVAFDLKGLSQMLRASWPTIQGKTGLQMSELDEADGLALRLAAAVAHRANSPELTAAATDIRQRMFTVFANTYDQLRRAIGYLRWDQGDIDSIIPSLYAGRASASGSKKNGNDVKPAPASDVPNNVTTTAVNATPAGNTKIPVGLPGSDPLMTA